MGRNRTTCNAQSTARQAACVATHLRPGHPPHGSVVALGPSARCIITLSSQRPNLWPTLSRVPTMPKAGGAVQFDGSTLRRVADHGDHLAEATVGRLGDQMVKQLPANAATLRLGIDVDRIFHGETIGWPQAIASDIGIAQQRAVEFGCDIGKAGIDQLTLAPRHFRLVRRLDFERRCSILDGMGIDPGDGGNVGGRGQTDRNGRHDVPILSRVNAVAQERLLSSGRSTDSHWPAGDRHAHGTGTPARASPARAEGTAARVIVVGPAHPQPCVPIGRNLHIRLSGHFTHQP